MLRIMKVCLIVVKQINYLRILVSLGPFAKSITTTPPIPGGRRSQLCRVRRSRWQNCRREDDWGRTRNWWKIRHKVFHEHGDEVIIVSKYHRDWRRLHHAFHQREYFLERCAESKKKKRREKNRHVNNLGASCRFLSKQLVHSILVLLTGVGIR